MEQSTESNLREAVESLEEQVQQIDNRLQTLEHKVQEQQEFIKPHAEGGDKKPYHKRQADGMTPPQRTLAKGIVIEQRRNDGGPVPINGLKERFGEKGFSRVLVRKKIGEWLDRGLLEEPKEGVVELADDALITIDEELENPVDWDEIDPSGKVI